MDWKAFLILGLILVLVKPPCVAPVRGDDVGKFSAGTLDPLHVIKRLFNVFA